MEHDDKMIEQEVRHIFQKDRKTIFEPSSQSLSFVLKSLHLDQAKPKRPKSVLVAGASLMMAILVGVSVYLTQQGHTASLNQHVLVSMDFKNLDQQIVRGQIELPQGIEFFSKQYPEIAAQRTLDFDGGVFDQGQFPFLVKTTEKGTKVIKVKFYNSENQVVAERSYKIKVKNATEEVIL